MGILCGMRWWRRRRRRGRRWEKYLYGVVYRVILDELAWMSLFIVFGVLVMVLVMVCLVPAVPVDCPAVPPYLTLLSYACNAHVIPNSHFGLPLKPSVFHPSPAAPAAVITVLPYCDGFTNTSTMHLHGRSCYIVIMLTYSQLLVRA